MALAPQLTNLTLPLNASAIYFGVAAGTFIGGQALQVGPASELGLIAAAFPIVGLVVLGGHRLFGGSRVAMSPGE